MSFDSASGKLRQTAMILVLIAFFLIFPGCRLVYLFQVATGQLQLLNGAIPVEDALKELAALDFAED